MIAKLPLQSKLIPGPDCVNVAAFKRGVSQGKLHHVHNIAGTKLVKRFIKRARGEAYAYRTTLVNMYRYVDIR